VLVLVPEEDEKVAVEGRRWSWEREGKRKQHLLREEITVEGFQECFLVDVAAMKPCVVSNIGTALTN
jgi:hypothetical protein